MRLKWMERHVCQDPTCAPGDCTLDRWYPNAPLTTYVYDVIMTALRSALTNGHISVNEFNIAILELARGTESG